MEMGQMNQNQTPQGKKRGMSPAAIVAIVAIALAVVIGVSMLVRAIALPLGGMMISNAEKEVQDANARAVRAAAVTTILTQNIPQGDWGWEATATVDDEGNMSDLTVTPADSAVTDVMPDDTAGTYIVGVQLEESADDEPAQTEEASPSSPVDWDRDEPAQADEETLRINQEKAREANVRAIRAAAVTEILTQSIPQGDWGWEARATVDDEGNIDGLTVTPADSAFLDATPDMHHIAGDYIVGISADDMG